MYIPDTSRKYTPEEKQQLLQNLDIEVEHRVRQLEEWLADALKNFRLHQEGLISRVPKLVRGVTMGEFADTYNGNIQACLRGLVGGAPPNLEIDRETRKRKWEEASEGERAVKNAKTMHATPKRKPPPANTASGTAQRVRTFSAAVPRTPGQLRPTLRLPSVSPQKPSAFRTSPSKLRAPSPFRIPPSPGKSMPWNAKPPSQAKRPPTSATFAPTLPAKTPAYPTLRAPRRDESMLSLNGSPLANPYKLGLEWFATEEEEEEGIHDMDVKTKGKGKEAQAQVDAQGEGKTLRRVNSIVIRRDPSVSLVPSSSTQTSFSQTHSRAHSQTQNHNRMHSRTAARVPEPPALKPATPSLAPSSSLSNLPSSSSARAVVAISTSDGHVLEFDPLQTSPRALDALVGITDSAKKHAREEMGRLVQAAVNKWSIA